MSEKSKGLFSLHCFLEYRVYIKLEDLYLLVIQKLPYGQQTVSHTGIKCHLNNITP